MPGSVSKRRRAIVIGGSMSGLFRRRVPAPDRQGTEEGEHALLQGDGATLDWIAVPNFLDAYK